MKKPVIAPPASAPISRRGWKIIGGGIVTVVAGYIVLTMTDPRGQNWASQLSPLLLVGGYSVIGWGIVASEKKDES